ncbi:MAG: hypothetical protein HOP02_04760 [Methylococcaceae bacterium]|nr:hypothetical protein [Methylococcaceae bacterium]
MKTLHTSIAAVALFATLSGVAFAAGSTVQNSTISNSSRNQNVTNTANAGFIGDATANVGSNQIKGSTVQNSTISNSSRNQNVTNTANGGFIGDAKANVGSVVIE